MWVKLDDVLKGHGLNFSLTGCASPAVDRSISRWGETTPASGSQVGRGQTFERHAKGDVLDDPAAEVDVERLLCSVR